MKIKIWFCTIPMTIGLMGCAHTPAATVPQAEAAKLDRNLVRDAVVFESGAKDGAVIPEISAPRLRAVWIPERVENNRLIEAHREWLLEGNVSILGITPSKSEKKKGKHI
jgi:hypothetical protein